MEHGGLPRRKSLPISSSLWGEEGGSAQHQKPGEDASYAQTAATIAPTKHNHIAGSSPIRSFFFLSFFSSSSCETSSVVRVRQHQPQFSSPLVPHRNVFCLKAQARGFLVCVRACARLCVCVCPWFLKCAFLFPLPWGIIFLFLFFFPLPPAFFSVSAPHHCWHLQKCGAPYGNMCMYFPFSVGPLLEIDREEGLNWKIGFPLRKHVVSAPSYQWCSRKCFMIRLRLLSQAVFLFSFFFSAWILGNDKDPWSGFLRTCALHVKESTVTAPLSSL